jgi:tRNA 2-thiouridine synthesizing protein A
MSAVDTGLRRLDTRGLKCPWPVLRAARIMREVDAVLILADDPVALIDIPALAQANDWTIEIVERDAHAEYRLQKSIIGPSR